MFEDFNKKIEDARIIPVVKVDVAEDALSIAKSLLAGGINAMEITFRTTEGETGYKKIAECIGAVCKNMGNMLVGAGTVINAELARKAIDAGAKFIVSPGFNPETVDYCISRNVPVYPGVNSPSQIEVALSKKLNVLKFFPAEESGGLKMLKSLSGPFPTVRFMATGGINEKNAPEYLSAPNIAAIGGSWMVKPALIKDRNWAEITRLSKKAVDSVNGKIGNAFAEYKKWLVSDIKNDSITEEQKMKAGKLYDSSNPSLVEKRRMAHNLCKDYNDAYEDDPVRKEILSRLFPDSGENLYLHGPIQFDYGFNTYFGKNCHANFNFVVLDVCPVNIGDNCFFGPNCTIATPMHPFIPKERRNYEYAKPVNIGNNCWISSGVTVCGGVTIGEGCVIGAGSVVTHDIPANSLAAGNPCKVIRPLTDDDLLGIPDDI